MLLVANTEHILKNNKLNRIYLLQLLNYINIELRQPISRIISLRRCIGSRKTLTWRTANYTNTCLGRYHPRSKITHPLRPQLHKICCDAVCAAEIPPVRAHCRHGYINGQRNSIPLSMKSPIQSARTTK